MEVDRSTTGSLIGLVTTSLIILQEQQLMYQTGTLLPTARGALLGVAVAEAPFYITFTLYYRLVLEYCAQ